MIFRFIRSYFQVISNGPSFFLEIQPQRGSPFWVHEYLVLQLECRDVLALTQSEIENETRLDYETGSDTEFSEAESNNIEEAEDLDCKNEILRLSSSIDIMTCFVEMSMYQ